MNAASSVLAGLPAVRSWQEEFYRDLHRNPELSHQEHATAGKVAHRLRASGFTVHEGVGGTGVVGVLRNGEGATVLLRADMDALPLREGTGLPYASAVTAVDARGAEVPVAHACGHDMHVTCLVGAAELLAGSSAEWRGTVVALFQPAEETGDGARTMVADGLADLVPTPDAALAQHVVPGPAGWVGTCPGPVFATAESLRITVYGRGGHGALPHATVDPVVLAATIVVRLQTVVSRETPPRETAVLTVGNIRTGSRGGIIPNRTEIELVLSSFSAETRAAMAAAVRRIVVGECHASGCPREPDIETVARFPLTLNDEATTARVADAFAAFFGEAAQTLTPYPASEDFSDIPNALGTPYTYWGVGCLDPDLYREAVAAGRADEAPVNHSADFAPVIQPTCDIGTQALVVAALAWLAR